ncbi:MAG TPA: CPBP family glutamic-type intramembrane protease [Caulobacteraceae bacterium]|jgi:membrane protease YdiL (CAAX protease family)|nr:CPBP family glutamic-type intramembrane protease [Caulobacteraceae bacterium]
MFAADFANPWIMSVRQARRRTPAAVVAIVGLIFPGALLFVGHATASIAGQAPSDLIVFACLAIAAIVATRLEGRRLWPRETYGLAAVIGGVALGLGAVFACAAVASIAGAVGVITGPSSLPAGPLAAAILIAALGAAAQEMFFRGWIQPVLCAAWGAWPGLFLTAAAFAVFHVAAGPQGPLAVVNLLLAGLLLGLLALRSGGLATSTAAHLMWTWSAFAGVALSPTGPIAQVRLSGPTLWSGGDQGLGGSLATTAVLVVLLASLQTVKPRVVAPRAES